MQLATVTLQYSIKAILLFDTRKSCLHLVTNKTPCFWDHYSKVQVIQTGDVTLFKAQQSPHSKVVIIQRISIGWQVMVGGQSQWKLRVSLLSLLCGHLHQLFNRQLVCGRSKDHSRIRMRLWMERYADKITYCPKVQAQYYPTAVSFVRVIELVFNLQILLCSAVAAVYIALRWLFSSLTLP